MLWTNSTTLITSNLRVIRNARQFYHALSHVVMVQCRNVGVTLLTP
ncbi:DUF3265 domain-containing protein [Vibrio vulnificus]|nr:DUF3265 domain-containing protein [Vibrio vulnificus]EGQ7953549.1 DUF3265 domain-containing protein [Vibrio vulnificus]EGQ8002330.1 DUF3265 domain-containing protein [Vibrio vulnificus]EGQ9294347.1 DUF3265 domain-containing protein [Vibrio vulnificus]EHV2843413.1 DUF3265 domain-containing protein [Vibrio vulnificus]EHY0957193.1 DUF3265 domain-containing protein [Vibrio vulnificus]